MARIQNIRDNNSTGNIERPDDVTVRLEDVARAVHLAADATREQVFARIARLMTEPLHLEKNALESKRDCEQQLCQANERIERACAEIEMLRGHKKVLLDIVAGQYLSRVEKTRPGP